MGALAAERNLPVQSHLSENQAEIAWVRQLHPDCAQYWETYAKYGLWNDRTVMAHCVWSDSRERTAMREAGAVSYTHLPSLLGSGGLPPVFHFKQKAAMRDRGCFSGESGLFCLIETYN